MSAQSNTEVEYLPPPSVPLPEVDATEIDERVFALSGRGDSASAETSSEGPSESISLPANPVVAHASPVAPETKATSSTSPALPSSWLSQQKTRREVPKAAKVGGGGVVLLMLLVFLAPKACDSGSTTTRSSAIAKSDVGDAEHLKKRRHLTDADFRSNRAPVAPAPPAPSTEDVDLAERQRLREANPEDIRTASKRRSSTPGNSRTDERAPELKEEESLFVIYNAPAEASSGAAEGARRMLLPAASLVSISLKNDVVVRRGRTPVIAFAQGGQLPEGTKLIGFASAGYEGTLTLRFETVVLPDGKSIKVRAEAVDVATGSAELVGSVTGGALPRSEPGVARSVGTSTAGQVASGVLGPGILGGAAQQTLSASTRSRTSSRSTARVVTLSRATPLQVLFLRELLSE